MIRDSIKEALSQERGLYRTMTLKQLVLSSLAFISIGGFILSDAGPARYAAAFIRQGAEPGIRFSSGLTVTDEVLRHGRWINRYWLSTGIESLDVTAPRFRRRCFKDGGRKRDF